MKTKIRDFIEKQNWIFAKTYSHKAPHEYVVRNNIVGTDEEFLEIVDYILENGITMYFWNHPNKYIFLDGRQYWVMREGKDDPTTILNRCDLNDYKISIQWKGSIREDSYHIKGNLINQETYNDNSRDNSIL
jgi:hypothetical protein